jgi:hypothetical protein
MTNTRRVAVAHCVVAELTPGKVSAGLSLAMWRPAYQVRSTRPTMSARGTGPI